MGAAGGVKREVVRTLGTTDRQEAKRRRQPALVAIQATIEAALRAAGLPPLTDWTADWATHAVGLRAILRPLMTPRWTALRPATASGTLSWTAFGLKPSSFRRPRERPQREPFIRLSRWTR